MRQLRTVITKTGMENREHSIESLEDGTLRSLFDVLYMAHKNAASQAYNFWANCDCAHIWNDYGNRKGEKEILDVL